MVDRLVAVNDTDYRLPAPVLAALGEDIAEEGSPINTVLVQAANVAVTNELNGTAVVVGGLIGTDATDLAWVQHTDRIPADDRIPVNDRIPATTVGSPQRVDVPVLDSNGKVATSVLPADVVLLDTGGKIPADLIPDPPIEPVSDGRPSYAPETGGTFDATTGLFNYRPDQMLNWTAAREAAAVNALIASVQIAGDSISRVIGSPQPGEDANIDAWPWQLLNGLGLPVAGRGIRFSNGGLIHVNPGTSTNRLDLVTGGFFSDGMVKITDDGARTAYVRLPDYADVPEYEELWFYGGDLASGTSDVTVDGVTYTWAGNSTVAGADIPCLPGYPSGQRVGKLSVTRGPHDVRVHGTATGTVTVGGVEGRLLAGLVVHQTGFSGKTLAGFTTTTVGNLAGTQWGVIPRANLFVDSLGINDFQAHSSVAAFRDNRLSLWAAAKATGADVICLVTPRPDYALYPPDGIQTPSHDEYFAATYSAALEADIPVIDIAYLWKNYERSAALYGPGVDHIHPNLNGLRVLTSRVKQLLLNS